MMNQNVVKIRTEEETIEHIFDSFVAELSHNSKATAKAYGGDVRHFIKEVFPLGMQTPISTAGDYITYSTITQHRKNELDRGIKSTSVNRKTVAIREFSKHMRIYKVPVDLDFFQDLKSLRGESHPHEVISIVEGIMIAEWLKSNEKFRAKAKYYYAILALDTAVRAEALSSLTPSNFIEMDDHVVIKGVDKGKKNFTKRINKELYNDMKKDIPEWTAGKQKIFNFGDRVRHDMIKRALKGLGWEDRKITFHSFKKAAVNHAFEKTGDIRVAMTVASHTSVATTQRYLSEEGEDFLGAISNGNLKKIKTLEYNDFSKEELVEAIEQMSKNYQYQLKSELVKKND